MSERPTGPPPNRPPPPAPAFAPCAPNAPGHLALPVGNLSGHLGFIYFPLISYVRSSPSSADSAFERPSAPPPSSGSFRVLARPAACAPEPGGQVSLHLWMLVPPPGRPELLRKPRPCGCPAGQCAFSWGWALTSGSSHRQTSPPACDRGRGLRGAGRHAGCNGRSEDGPLSAWMSNSPASRVPQRSPRCHCRRHPSAPPTPTYGKVYRPPVWGGLWGSGGVRGSLDSFVCARFASLGTCVRVGRLPVGKFMEMWLISFAALTF